MPKISKFTIFRLSLWSRKRDAAIWLKNKTGWPKNIENFRDGTARIIDGKKKSRD